MRLEPSPDYQNCKTSIRFVWQLGTAILLSALFSLCVGCAGISASGAQPNPSNAKISLSPSTATISSGAQQQFSASLTPTARTEKANSAIFWRASAGTISQSGLFTAPTVTSSTRVTVIATGVADPTSVAVSEVTVVPQNKIAISLSPATATISSGGKQQFSAALTSTSNTAVTWRASAGTISSNGIFTAPSVAASTKVTVTATSIADGSMVA